MGTEFPRSASPFRCGIIPQHIINLQDFASVAAAKSQAQGDVNCHCTMNHAEAAKASLAVAVNDAVSEEGEDDNGIFMSIFNEPEDYYKSPDPPRWVTHTLLNGQTLEMRLVGSNPLWAHHIWNGALALSQYLEEHPELLKPVSSPVTRPATSHRANGLNGAGVTVLELGAGAGLPSIVSAIYGASKVVVTDYPDGDVIENLKFNVEKNNPLYQLSFPHTERKSECGNAAMTGQDGTGKKECIIEVEGYLWGADPGTLLRHLPQSSTSPLPDPKGIDEAGDYAWNESTRMTEMPERQGSRTSGFALLLLADLLYNHSCHNALVDTITSTLAHSSPSNSLYLEGKPQSLPHPRALVFFTPYRPHLLEKDMAFFDLCKQRGLVVKSLVERDAGRTMFKDDKGDEWLRRRVFGFEISWPEERGS